MSISGGAITTTSVSMAARADPSRRGPPGGLRRGDHIDVVVHDGLGVPLGQRLPERLLAGHLGAEPRLEDGPGRLARAEARDADLLGDALERTVERLVDLGLIDLDGQLHLVALEGFDGRLHRRASVLAGPFCPVRGFFAWVLASPTSELSLFRNTRPKRPRSAAPVSAGFLHVPTRIFFRGDNPVMASF